MIKYVIYRICTDFLQIYADSLKAIRENHTFMKKIKLNKQNHELVINETIKTLKSGGLVVFPSDTVYVFLVDSCNPASVSRLLELKERGPGKAISVFVADKKMAEEYVILNQNANNIINNLLPGPFTIVCESKHQTDQRLEAENGTLGIRIPDYSLTNNLVTTFNRPVTATSANVSSQPPFYSTKQLISALSKNKKEMIDLVIDAGNLPRHKPSTVIDTTSGELKTLRLGDLFPTAPNKLISKSEKETIELGRFLATKFIKKCVSNPLIFLLQGELGTGKTILTKGIGKAFKIKEVIVSPTYTLSYEYVSPMTTGDLLSLTEIDIKRRDHSDINELSTNIKLIHYDLYRIDSANDLDEINFFENFVCGNVYVIEWPDRIPEKVISALKKSAEIVFVTLKHSAENDKNLREISWTTIGD